MDELISVIIPVYNNENSIRKCLLSIENQTYGNYEVIIVNDGSTDNTIDICENFRKKYKNIVILNQNNKGVSSARNLGIKESKGKYLMFVDGDDTLEKEALITFTSKLREKDYDIIIANYNNVKNKEKIPNNTIHKLNFKLDLFDFISLNYVWAPWGKLIKKQFILNYFDEQIYIAEDALFWLENNNKCSYTYIDKELYNHFYNKKSAMNNRILSEREISSLYAFEKIIKESKNKEIKDIYMIQYLNNYFNYRTKYIDNKKLIAKLDKKYKQNVKKYYIAVINSNNIKFILKLKMFIKYKFIYI